MSKTTAYADLGKDGNDLITLGFPVSGEKTQTWKQASSVQINHEASPNGFSLKTSVLQGPKGVNLTFKPEYKWKLANYPVVFKAKADTASDLTEGSVGVSDLLVPGTEITPWFKRGVEDKVLKQSGGLTIGFTNELVNFSVKTDSPSDFSQHKVDANLVLQFPASLYWGLNGQYTVSEKHPHKDLNFKLHYARPDSAFTAALETNPKEKQKELSLTWLQTVSDALKVVARFVVPVQGVPTSTVAASHKWDSATTLKAKASVGKEARLVVSYAQVVTPYATATLGADLNANRLVGYQQGADHSFGLEVKLK
jgi:hypothetical protein